MSKKRRPTRRYSAEEKAEALRRAKEVGVAAAVRELGIAKSTVYQWVAEAKSKEEGADGPEPKNEARKQPKESEPREKKTDTKSKVARRYTPSERARALELAAEVGVAEAGRQLGISRFSIYEWQRKLKLFNAGKAETSPVEGTDEDVEAARDRKILEMWKTHPGLGPSQVRNQLRRGGMKVSVHRVRRVMEADGYVPRKIKRTNHDQRYEAIRPNHLWHLDFLHRFVNKQRIYVLIILDDFSRFIAGARIWEGERVDIVMNTFEEATMRHGRPEMIMSDGGSAFWSWRGVSRFTRLLEEMGIDQLIAKVPQINGKLEVLNANAQKELFNVERFFDLEQTHQRFEAWVEFYNYRRTHHSLGGLLVPADRYFGRGDRVLAAIESGRSADGVGAPVGLGERHLDLLRVVSHQGQAQVYLMGQRIWPTG